MLVSVGRVVRINWGKRAGDLTLPPRALAPWNHLPSLRFLYLSALSGPGAVSVADAGPVRDAARCHADVPPGTREGGAHAGRDGTCRHTPSTAAAASWGIPRVR